MGIHDYEGMYASELRKIKDSEISSKNKDLILRFHESLVLENISKARLVNVLGTMRRFVEKLGMDLDAVGIDDIKSSVVGIQQRDDLSAWTKRDYKIIIRRFFKWLHGTKGYPEIVDWIKIGVSRSQLRLPANGELITSEEGKNLIEAASHPRDKALVSALWESGARVSEIGTLRLKNVQFDRHGSVITVCGKTGSRKIRLVTSTPYLSTWINCHPTKTDPESPLWVNIGQTQRGRQMNYAGICKALRTLGKKCGLRKKTNPHFFRHSRATHMANHLTEFQMNQYFGWIQGSNMPAIYVHMSGKEVDKAVLAMNGIEEDREESKREKARVCPRCEIINDVSTEFCFKCGAILDEKHAAQFQEKENHEGRLRSFSDELMNHLLKDEEVQRLIAKKMQSIGAADFAS